MKIYYTYLIIFKDNGWYIGKSSCEGNPMEDGYFGSGADIPNEENVASKLVLSTHTTDIEAKFAEALLHKLNNVEKHVEAYNAMEENPEELIEELTEEFTDIVKPKGLTNPFVDRLTKGTEYRYHGLYKTVKAGFGKVLSITERKGRSDIVVEIGGERLEGVCGNKYLSYKEGEELFLVVSTKLDSKLQVDYVSALPTKGITSIREV